MFRELLSAEGLLMSTDIVYGSCKHRESRCTYELLRSDPIEELFDSRRESHKLRKAFRRSKLRKSSVYIMHIMRKFVPPDTLGNGRGNATFESRASRRRARERSINAVIKRRPARKSRGGWKRWNNVEGREEVRPHRRNPEERWTFL